MAGGRSLRRPGRPKRRAACRDHPWSIIRDARDARAWSPWICNAGAFRRTALYRKIYQPRGSEYQRVMRLPNSAPGTCAIVLQRAREDFSDEERQALELLWPHLIQALRNVRSFSRLHDSGTVRNLMEGRGIVVLDRDCNVELCTEQARLWLARYCSETFLRGRIELPEKVAKWVADQLADKSPPGHSTARSARTADAGARVENFLTIRMIAIPVVVALLVLEEETLNAPPWRWKAWTDRARAEVLAWSRRAEQSGGRHHSRHERRTVQKHMEHVFESSAGKPHAAILAHGIAAAMPCWLRG